MFSKRRRLEPKKSFPSTASLSGCCQALSFYQGNRVSNRHPWPYGCLKGRPRSPSTLFRRQWEGSGDKAIQRVLEEHPRESGTRMGGRERMKGFLQLSLGNRGKEKSARQRGKHVQYLEGGDAWPLWEP